MITFSDIVKAAQRIDGFAAQTPILTSEALDEQLGAHIYIKAEFLQKTGAFKFRGAVNSIAALLEKENKPEAVLAWSSGNHAQAVAKAAKLFNLPATIVMPADAPQMKIDGTKSYGAEVVLYDRATESREEIGAAIAKDTGAAIIPPFDSPYTMAGQGTAGLEMANALKTRDVALDHFLCPCSGGGLASGCFTAIHHFMPDCQFSIVEPMHYDEMTHSLDADEKLSNDPNIIKENPSICDALMNMTAGDVAYPYLQKMKNQGVPISGVAVSDKEVMHAMRWAFENLKMVIEPGGATALAAILTGKIDVKGKHIGIIASGGNVDAALFAKAITS